MNSDASPVSVDVPLVIDFQQIFSPRIHRLNGNTTGMLLCFFVLASCRFSTLEKTVLDVAGIQLTVEIADTPEARKQGLMYRKAIGENEGMIFVFDKESRVSFWMKNTDIPLSIAFIAANGTIRQIEDMEPRSMASVSSYRHIRYALEVNRGWFIRNGVTVGSNVDVSSF